MLFIEIKGDKVNEQTVIRLYGSHRNSANYFIRLVGNCCANSKGDKLKTKIDPEKIRKLGIRAKLMSLLAQAAKDHSWLSVRTPLVALLPHFPELKGKKAERLKLLWAEIEALNKLFCMVQWWDGSMREEKFIRIESKLSFLSNESEQVLEFTYSLMPNASEYLSRIERIFAVKGENN